MACALTTLAHVKAWLAITGDAGDANLERLIQSASRFILSYIGRSTVCVQQYEELYDGNGKTWMLLKQWPILSIASIAFRGGVTITTQLSGANTGSGFTINPLDSPDEGPQRVTLWGYCFPQGRDMVFVTYTAGFQQSDTLQIVGVPADTPTAGAINVDALSATWAGAIEVLDDNGVALTQVASAPAAGQYTVDALGNYGFNVADVGATVTIVYSFVPADLEQAAYEMVGEAVRYQQRIGVKSKTLGGQETIVWDNNLFNDRAMALLQNYRRVAPL